MPETLFGPDPLEVTAEQIEQIEASSVFREWAKRMLRSNHLQPIINVLMERLGANSACEALTLLAGSIQDAAPELIARSDVCGRLSIYRVFSRLMIAAQGLNGNGNHSQSNYRAHGVVGHQVLTRLFQLQIPMGFETQQPRPPGQTHLFGEEAQHNYCQGVLFSRYDLSSYIIPPSILFKGAKPLKEHLERIRLLKDELVALTSTNQDFVDQLFATRRQSQLLRDLLFPFFGSYLDRIVGRETHWNEYLELITLLTWASTLLFIFDSCVRYFLFAEIPVLNFKNGLSGGRLDGLRIVSIDGEPLDKKQFQQLGALSRNRFASVTRVIRKVQALYPGADIKWEIIDWKMAVGDGTAFHPITADDIKIRPLTKHLHQMEYYLLMAWIDEHLTRYGTKKPDWSMTSNIVGASIVYCLPTGPIIHQVELDSYQLEKLFVKRIVQKWDRALSRAQVRMVHQQVVDYIITELMSGRKRTKNIRAIADNLMSEWGEKPIVQLISHYQQED